jgi:tetratricopeptide (TPR) repeat protein
MKPKQGTSSVSDRRLTRLLWAGLLTLTVGISSFGVIYYGDHYVDPGPTLLERQVQTAEKAVRTAPTNIGTRLQLAQVYRTVNQPDDALKQYDEILKADSTNRTALLGRGDVFVSKGDLVKAAPSYQKIVGKASKSEFAGNDPQLAQAYFSLGDIALKQGHTKDAVVKLESAVKIDPGDADAWYVLGTANMRLGAPEKAAEAFRTALKFVPTGWCEPYSQLQVVYKKLGEAAEAEYAGAMVDFCQKRPAESKRRLQTLTSGPAKIEAMLGLGMIAEAASDRAGAVRWYEKVLSTDPKNFSARTGLSRLNMGKTG